MPETERHSRAEGLRRAVREHEFQDWLDAILRDVPAQCCGHCGELASAHVEPISTMAVEEDYAAAVGGGS
jgi:hypothetical protein